MTSDPKTIKWLPEPTFYMSWNKFKTNPLDASSEKGNPKENAVILRSKSKKLHSQNEKVHTYFGAPLWGRT